MPLSIKKLSLSAIATIIIIIWLLSFHFITFDAVKTMALQSVDYAITHPFLASLGLFAVHFTGMLLSLPTKGIFTIVAGALLGIVTGSIITLTGVLSGTTILFYISRKVSQKNSSSPKFKIFEQFKKRVKNYPVLSVAGLRLILTIPYGPITVMSALSNIKYSRFLLGSIIGDLPVIILYTAAGMKLSSLTDTKDALSWQTVLILSSAGIAMFLSVFLKKNKHL